MYDCGVTSQTSLQCYTGTLSIKLQEFIRLNSLIVSFKLLIDVKVTYLLLGYSSFNRKSDH